jgi:hypothetical protein
MRFPKVLFLIGALLTTNVFSQTVFTPSPIDFKQDERLELLEKEVARLDVIDSELFDIKETQAKILAKVDALAAKPVVVEQPKPVVKPQTVVSTPKVVEPVRQVSQPQVSSGLYTTDELRAIFYKEWPNGYRVRAADVSPRSQVWNHLTSGIHGFQPSQVQGLTQQEALGIHDLHHAGLIRANRGSYRGGSIVSRPAQLTYNSIPPTQSAPPRNAPIINRPVFNSGCPNGQCARQRANTTTQSGGWYLGKNLGR